MRTEEIIKTAKLVEVLYSIEGGGAGGYGHIVFDDDNVDDADILFCIKEAKDGLYDLSEDVRIASLNALESMLELTIEERKEALYYSL